MSAAEFLGSVVFLTGVFAAFGLLVRSVVWRWKLWKHDIFRTDGWHFISVISRSGSWPSAWMMMGVKK